MIIFHLFFFKKNEKGIHIETIFSFKLIKGKLSLNIVVFAFCELFICLYFCNLFFQGNTIVIYPTKNETFPHLMPINVMCCVRKICRFSLHFKTPTILLALRCVWSKCSAGLMPFRSCCFGTPQVWEMERISMKS